MGMVAVFIPPHHQAEQANGHQIARQHLQQLGVEHHLEQGPTRPEAVGGHQHRQSLFLEGQAEAESPQAFGADGEAAHPYIHPA